MKVPVVGLVTAALLAALASPGAAAPAASVKCDNARKKCVRNYAVAVLECYRRAQLLAPLPPDPACFTKAAAKFESLSTGCMAKAELKPPCTMTGDASGIRYQTDIAMGSLGSLATPFLGPPFLPSPLIRDLCAAARLKCLANTFKALMICHEKAQKLGLPPDPACIAKARTKLETPTTGCWDKAAAFPACQYVPYTASAVAERLFGSESNQFAPLLCQATPLQGSRVRFTTRPGSGNCVSLANGSSREEFACGTLAMGGGNPAWSDPVIPLPPGQAIEFKLLFTSFLGPLTAAETGDITTCSEAGCAFGQPVPIALGGFSMCMVNVLSSYAHGLVEDCGARYSLEVPLTMTLYQTANEANPCVGCEGGYPCTPTGVLLGSTSQHLLLSNEYLEHETSDGLLCTPQTNPGAFGRFPAPGYLDLSTQYAVDASTYLNYGPADTTLSAIPCIGAADAFTNALFDLPGPGAMSLPVTVEMLP